MSQVITNAFEQYWQFSLSAEQPVVLDEFVLADIPNLDITAPIDPDTVLPPQSQIVHRQTVDQRGRVNSNAVAYSIVMDTTLGDFSFNAMYLRNKANGVIGMIVYKGRETKHKTDQTTGQTGNSLVKSMLMGYDQAAEATLTQVDAGTWQIDYAARLRGQDEDLRQVASQLYGHHTFIGDGFKVVQKDGDHQVTPGVAIVGGLRVELKQPEVIYPGSKPIGVWVDVHRAGSLLSEHQNHFTIITSVADLTDHVDGNGYHHYVAKLGTVQADNTVVDGRGQGGGGGSGAIPDTFALWKRSMTEAGYNTIGCFELGGTVANTNDVLLLETEGRAYSWGGTLPKTVPAGSTPATSGGVGAGSWIDRSNAIPPGYVNVKTFGAKGDGASDDSTAIQAAFTKAGVLGFGVYFPSGTYVINTTCVLPTQSITVRGEWANTIIKGAASSLFALPKVNGTIHTISRLTFEYPSMAINATKLWVAAGMEPGLIISECRFNSTANNSTAILLSGIWSGRIYANSFDGFGGKTGEETAVSIVTGDDMDSCVMNIDIQNNSTMSIAYPVKYLGRTLSAGGRVEGLSIIGNKFVSGKTGILLTQTSVSCINGNMCSDFTDYGIDLYGDFDFTISGNMDLTAGLAAIRLNELAISYVERGVITGNRISVKSGFGGILFNAPSGDVMRGITICGNMIGRNPTSTKGLYGIKYVGSGISNIAITGNVFTYLTTAIDRGTDVGNTTINANIYSSVDNMGVSSSHNTPFTASIVENLVGGTSYVFTVPLPAGAAKDRPHFATCVVASVMTGSPIVAVYKYDSSTKNQLQFTLTRVDGSALPSSAVRFAVAALPF